MKNNITTIKNTEVTLIKSKNLLRITKKILLSKNADMTNLDSNYKLHIGWGHKGHINTILISSDGKYIVSGDWDATIKLWDIESGEALKTFKGHKGFINTVSMSSDGKYIISGGNDGTIRLWDILSEEELKIFEGHRGNILSVAITTDAKYIVSGSSDTTIKLWSIESGQEVYTLKEHTGSVKSVAVTPDGKYIVSGSSDKTIKLWNIENGQELRTFEGNINEINSVTVTPDGKYIVSGGTNGFYDKQEETPDATIKLWNIENGEEIRTFEKPENDVNTVTITPDGKYIVSGGRDSQDGYNSLFTGFQHSMHESDLVKLWDIENGQEVRIFERFLEKVTSTAVSPDGKYVISAGWDKIIKLWDIKSGQKIRTFDGITTEINSVIITFNKKYIVSTESKGFRKSLENPLETIIKLWDIQRGKMICTLEENNDILTPVGVTSNEKYIVFRNENKTIKLWDVSTGSLMNHFTKIEEDSIELLSDTPNGKYIIVGSNDGFIKLRDIETGREIAQYVSFEDGNWISSTPDGYYNCSEGARKYFNLFDESQGMPKVIAKDHPIYKERKREILLDNKTYTS